MKNKHALLFFDTELNLGKSFNPNKWVNYLTKYYEDGKQALRELLDCNSITTQLISADTDEELEKERKKMIRKFKSEKWLDKLLSQRID